MIHRATLTIALDSEPQARRLAASFAPDDDGHLSVRVDGAELVLETAAHSPMGLLRTLDEAVAQLAAAQKAERVGSTPRR